MGEPDEKKGFFMGGKRKQEGPGTKEVILSAAEHIMREEGYAAVSSRRVADKAGSKTIPIHYHFGSMDDLFLALYRRSDERFLAKLVGALSSETPLHDLWQLSQGSSDAGLIVEFLALANHRISMQQEVARSGDRTRTIATALVATSLKDVEFKLGSVSPAIVAFMLQAVARTLVSDRALGISCSHDEVLAFVERLLDQVEPPVKIAPRKRAVRKAPGNA